MPETAVGKVPGHERIMLLLLGVTVAAVFWLISAGEGREDGQVPWKSGSILRVVTDLMTLFHRYPTMRGTEIKWLVQSVGAATAMVAATVIWFARRREDSPVLTAGRLPVSDRALTLPSAAQLALVAFGLWTLASFLWAPWPDAAFGEAIRLATGIAWAIAIGRTLSPRGARRGAEILLGILAVTALLGVWYHFERNPVQRLKFPIGNPIFFAACLLPGFTIACAVAASAVFGDSQEEPRTAQKASARGRLIRGMAAAVALVLLAGAFTEADSRGPGIGLAVGIIIALFLLLSRFWRIILGVGLAAGVGLLALLQLWPVSWLFSRPDTVRFRLHAWHYAWQIFLSRPLGGRGQGAYLLLAQGMSRPDAVNDPTAFPGPLLGHAHNEWLEILADLGAIGLAFVAIALGITFWGAVVALRCRYRGATRRPKSPEGWYLLALLAALAAIMIEAASDVSCRMPGLTVIFFTVLGLVWALSNPAPASAESVPTPPEAEPGDAADTPRSARERLRRPARVLVLLGAFAGAWLIGSTGMRDWLGALAAPGVVSSTTKGHYDDALQATLSTSGGRLGVSPRLSWGAIGRLSVESRLEANYQVVYVTREAAAQRVAQLRQTIEDSQRSRRDLNAVRELAREDATNFYEYFKVCTLIGDGLLSVIPGYPEIAGLVGDAWIFRRDMEVLIESLGGPPVPEEGKGHVAMARRYLMAEFQNDPLDAENGLRLLHVAQSDPMPARINCLRLPLRRSGITPGVEPALADLMQDAQFQPALDELLAKAEAALDASDAEWADPYAPETLRLASLAARLRGDYARGATLAEQAAVLSAYLVDRWAAAFGQCRWEQAQCLFLANPDAATVAFETLNSGLKGWPARANPQQHSQALRDISLYALAAGDVPTARAVIEHLVGQTMNPTALEYNIGYGYTELCETFLPRPPDKRPARFDEWLHQALQSVPHWMPAHVVAAYVALERKDDARARQQLALIRETAEEPRRLVGAMRSLLAAFPKHPVLQQFAAELTGAATQPEGADTQPENADSQPEGAATRPGSQEQKN